MLKESQRKWETKIPFDQALWKIPRLRNFLISVLLSALNWCAVHHSIFTSFSGFYSDLTYAQSEYVTFLIEIFSIQTEFRKMEFWILILTLCYMALTIFNFIWTIKLLLPFCILIQAFCSISFIAICNLFFDLVQTSAV